MRLRGGASGLPREGAARAGADPATALAVHYLVGNCTKPDWEVEMVARVTHVRVEPEDVEDSVRLFDESVVPAAEQEEGFMGALLLVREDGRALAIDLCDTLENMQANERNGFYQTQVSKFADRIVGRPAREFYRVAVSKGVRGGPELLAEADAG